MNLKGKRVFSMIFGEYSDYDFMGIYCLDEDTYNSFKASGTKLTTNFNGYQRANQKAFVRLDR